MRSIHIQEIKTIVDSYSPPLYYEFSRSEKMIFISYGNKKNGRFLIKKHPLPCDSMADDLVYINNILYFFDKIEEKISQDKYRELKKLFHLE